MLDSNCLNRMSNLNDFCSPSKQKKLGFLLLLLHIQNQGPGFSCEAAAGNDANHDDLLKMHIRKMTMFTFSLFTSADQFK